MIGGEDDDEEEEGFLHLRLLCNELCYYYSVIIYKQYKILDGLFSLLGQITFIIPILKPTFDVSVRENTMC